MMSLAVASGQAAATVEVATMTRGHRNLPSSGRRAAPDEACWSGHRSALKTIEPLDEKCLLVCWCDPTSGHYVDQVWINVTARRSGRCALTGLPIRRGDAIYKPQARGARVPANFNEMILLSALAGRS
jgi:hypothetical protein